MNYKYEVLSWVEYDNDFMDKVVYDGNNLIKALFVMWKQKRNGVGCVTFKCR